MLVPTSTLNPILLANCGEPTVTRDLKSGAGESDIAGIAARAAAGSVEAFEELALRFEPRIYGFLSRHLGNPHDAEDLTQETFVRAWRGIHRFDANRDFATWLFVIARRAAANHFRARKVHDELTDDLADAQSSASALALAADDAEQLWRAAKRLKPKCYEALWLRYAEGFSVAQTARVMGLTNIHLKVILHRARKELARHLKKELL